AVAMAVGLGFLSIALIGSGVATLIILSLGAITCAISIVLSILPRPDRFSPPGPAIDPATQSRLFAEVAAIAEEFGEPMPASVYLMMDCNAWVANRGGFLGFGSRRVMALGYPLLAVLTVSEFRAVIAHEFAHYYGGDTGFGPWTQKARDAIVGSLQRLSADAGFLHAISRWAYIGILRAIVVWTLALYWKLFLRLTLLVSRQWEYRADELASAVAGAKPLVECLRKMPRTTLGWKPDWATEALPSLNSGFLPPLADGFTRFLAGHCAPDRPARKEGTRTNHTRRARNASHLRATLAARARVYLRHAAPGRCVGAHVV
ncbi:MAG TPA: M48 family metallopeptidase, partial [Candidatus Solibacter sp.]|nr:M48 family metallopeptidase [Candidatus Solibacter sp.]